MENVIHDTDLVVIITTIPVSDTVDRFKQLIEDKTVACITAIPNAISHFLWNGAIEESSETVVLFKTTREKVETVYHRLTSLHTYEVPEFIVVPVSSVSSEYYQWVSGCLNRMR